MDFASNLTRQALRDLSNEKSNHEDSREDKEDCESNLTKSSGFNDIETSEGDGSGHVEN
jgi:hypothetical protein